ncbi:putative c6 finger domain-containing protein [Botrytis fragariae]|uniref:Putative c6 finger domain-containing protein n=1 Tax=Botrytis fragariae TaxID=1964551 RepID=A0A8H6B123_9HELO|nr:putative c6 finger domain-containing protein [Botrytis fragariae]KAF5877210.1 putative c6 finger domain-containing protein [Botrytis fragariae]
MELANIITGSTSSSNAQNRKAESTDPPQRTHSYPTRKIIMSGTDMHNRDGRSGTPPAPPYAGAQFNMNTPHSMAMSPAGSPTPKSVAFELLFTQSPQHRARLPMRVQIFPHDTTDSIIATVKNFYGLYADGAGAKGVSFEDEQGNTLIARYENFRNNMVVYVRVIQEEPSDAYGPSSYGSGSPRLQQAYYPGETHLPPHQALNYGHPVSRPTSRTSRKRSTSPGQGRGRRSVSASINQPLPAKKSRSRSGFKSRGSSTHGSFQELHSDGLNGYSSGDGGAGSVTSRAKSEHLGNTEISLDNIVEGGRRKRAKFESSELPLFAPPQMPAATSNSSVSPARRMENQRSSFPFAGFSQNPFSNVPNLHSPRSFGNANGFGEPDLYSTPAAQSRRTRGSYPSGRQSISTPGNMSDVLPTPDPTIGSCMSEEDKDVALQLMRLGDMSNISHGRISASTLDDTFSGRADAASSTGATSNCESESENELPSHRLKREPSPILPPGFLKKTHPHLEENVPTDSTEPSSDERDFEDCHDGTFKPGQTDDAVDSELAKPKVVKAKAARKPLPSSSLKSKANRISKPNRPTPLVKPKKANSVSASSKGPISPTSLPSQSRKTSVASTATHQHHLGDDEEDLSSKPRCQRCRKSKKGCDRQRPCGRCQDAGLGIDQCVSEDEGNGRKGRYGRHMGVPVKKDELPQVPIFPSALSASGASSFEKSKKRKR